MSDLSPLSGAKRTLCARSEYFAFGPDSDIMRTFIIATGSPLRLAGNSNWSASTGDKQCLKPTRYSLARSRKTMIAI